MSELSETIFSDLIVTADSHEQANCEVKTRVLCLQKFVEENGGCFQVEHLGDGYGLDYKVEGYFKDKEISLGIEYKQFINDFVPNHGGLENRLRTAREHYDNIALVIEGESLARTSRLVGDKNIWYVNPAVKDGLANQLMNRQMFEDRMQVWTESGILVRNIKQEEDFPDTFLYLLEYITKGDDWYSKHKIDLPNTSFKNQYINMILSSGIDKIGLKTAQKITTIYPNPYWLIVDGEDNLKDNIGKVTGGKLFNFFNNKDLITVEWQNGGNKAQLSKETEKSLVVNLRESSEILKEASNPELKYLDENKGKCIEVPKGKYQNGGQLFDIEPEESQLSINGQPETQSAGRISQMKKEPTDNPALQTLAGAGSKSSDDSKGKADETVIKTVIDNGNHGDVVEKTHCSRSASSDDKHRDDVSRTDEHDDKVLSDADSPKVGVNPTHPLSNLPEAPDNSEFKANPRMKDIEDFIRRHPRKLDDVSTEFGLSREYCFNALNELKNKKKIWFNKSTLCFEFGLDKNPSEVKAEPDLDIGV